MTGNGASLTVEQLTWNLVVANRILGGEGILDAFGHVSVRHPHRPDRFLMSWARSAELVEPGDIVEHDLDGTPHDPEGRAPYLERFIHGAVYEARPEVTAVCHHHVPTALPFSVCAEVPMEPVIHAAALLGGPVPVWDMADDFGPETDLLVRSLKAAGSLADRLGPGSVALMRGHGAVVAGLDLVHLVATCIAMDKNARVQLEALRLGPVTALSPGEIEAHLRIVAMPGAAGLGRAWDYYARRATLPPRPTVGGER